MDAQVDETALNLDGMQSGNGARTLTRADIKTLMLAALGGALEFYDFIVYGFLTPEIGKLFFPPGVSDWVRDLQAYALFAVAYFARPLGGVILAHFGDLSGRKRMFTLSILLMAVPTLLMGCLPTYENIGLAAPVLLLILRILQGAAVGGEVAGAWVFVSEHVPARNVGFACGTLTAGLTGGILLGSLAGTAMHTWLTPQDVLLYGWRVLFIAGGVFGIIAMLLRQWLHETPVFAAMQKRKALVAGIPVLAVLKTHLKSTAISMLLTWALTGGIIVIIIMTPNILVKLLHIDSGTVFAAGSMATLGLTLGCIVFGWLGDKVGAKPAIFVGLLLMAVCYYLFYTGMQSSHDMLLPWYGLTGFFVGVVGCIPLVLVNLFRAQVRFSGVSFSYNLAYAIFGGLTPVALPLLMKSNIQTPALYVVAVSIIGMAAVLSAPKPVSA
ncbi:MAG TPA: MFS transporter [Burkholderiaceae bacterium]